MSRMMHCTAIFEYVRSISIAQNSGSHYTGVIYIRHKSDFSQKVFHENIQKYIY